MLRKIKLIIFAVIMLGLFAPLASAQETHEHHHANGEKLGQVHPLSLATPAYRASLTAP